MWWYSIKSATNAAIGQHREKHTGAIILCGCIRTINYHFVTWLRYLNFDHSGLCIFDMNWHLDLIKAYVFDSAVHINPCIVDHHRFIFAITKIVDNLKFPAGWIDLLDNASFHQIRVANGDSRKWDVYDRNTIRAHYHNG